MQVRLSGTNGSYAGNELGTNADRSAAQWLKLRVESETLSYYKHGRIYDATPSNPRYYYFPSIAVNCAADMLLGFSGSSTSKYIGAYYVWRPGDGSPVQSPVVFREGAGIWNQPRWGDYSFTTVDPIDSQTFWTIQQYSRITEDWETWIAEIRVRR